MKSVIRGLAIILLVSLVAPLLAQPDRINGVIDNGRVIVLDSKVHPLALAEHGDEGLVEPSLQLPWMTLSFKRTPAQQDALTHLLAEQQDSASPNYHKWLSAEDYARQFGLSSSDMDRVAAWLEREGFRVEYRAKDRDFITFSGTAGQVRNAFRTEIHRYTMRGESHYMNATAPSIPEALSGVVLSLHGLTDVRLQPHVKRGKPAVTFHPNENDGGGVESLAPDDIATIYNIAPLYQQGINGTGQSVAILGGSRIDPNDIRAFRNHYHLSGTDPQIIECCGIDPGETMDDAEVEADLDVEWVSAVARNANIIFVYAQSNVDTVEYTVDNDLAPVVSESFGICEPVAAGAGVPFDAYEALAQTANAKGMTWMDSSGDSGAADCDIYGDPEASMGLAVEFPASMPEVTGVGGTEFNEGGGNYWGPNGPNLGSALGYIPEIAWNDSALMDEPDASGGGGSVYFDKPSWQTGPGVPADGMRDVPDVSLTASYRHDPYNIFTVAPSGQHVETTVGGTSASAPTFAGIVALLNQCLKQSGKGTAGNINPELYQFAQGSSGIFHDITTGSNIVPCLIGTPNCTGGSYGYLAGPGYDRVTGLGTVDAYKMVTAWTNSGCVPPAPTTSTTVTASPNPIFTNGWTQITATVAPTSGGGTPTGTVAFSAGSTTLGTATLAGGTASLQVTADKLGAGSDTITASYGGDGSFDASSGSTSVTVNQPASGVSFTADPNPIISTTGTGTTTLNWNASGYSQLVIRIDSSTGTPMTGTLPSSGSAQTGNWVTDQKQFFLIDLTANNPIASVTVQVCSGCSPPGPSLSSITPNTAPAGSADLTVQAAGSNFSSSSVVTWNGTPLATVYQSSTQLQATIPAADLASQGVAHVAVATGSQVTTSLPFTITCTPGSAGCVVFTANPNPIISSNGVGMTTLSWNAPGYSQLVITIGSTTGTPLTGTLGPTGTAQTGNWVTNGMQFFLVDLTTHASVASVTVCVGASAAACGGSGNAPVLASISPNSTPAGSGGLTLQAAGSNFTSTSVVTWNGSALPTQYQSSTSLQAAVPASDLITAGTAQVAVANGNQVSNSLPFTITACGGSCVTFTASPDPIISANGVGMTTLTWNAPGYSQLEITVNSQTGTPLTGTLGSSGTVQTGNWVTNGMQFFLVDLVTRASIASVTVPVCTSASSCGGPGPTLTSISPNTAQAGSGSLTLQANGSNFTSSSTVTWNGSPLATVFQSATQLQTIVPASDLVTAGTAQVAVADGSQVSQSLPFTITSPCSGSNCSTITFTASPNPIITSTGYGTTTLTWNAPGYNQLRVVAGWNPLTGTVGSSGSATTGNWVTSGMLFTLVDLTSNTTIAETAVELCAPGTYCGPFVASTSPLSAPAGSPATTLRVSGFNFTAASVVRWLYYPTSGPRVTQALATNFLSSTALEATIPAGLLENPNGDHFVEVFTDNNESNYMPFTITGTAPPPNLPTLVNSMMTKSVDMSSCATPTPAASFLATDPMAYLWFSINGGNAGDVAAAQWIAPDGSTYQSDSWNPLQNAGNYCFSDPMNIAGSPPASKPGTWKVVVTWNGNQFFTQTFTIGSGGGGTGSYDGQWSGTTSQYLLFSMTVNNNNITAYSYGINYPDQGPDCPTGATVKSSTSIPINGNTFSTGSLSGTFQSSTQGSGTLNWTLSAPGCSASGTLNWTASKQ